MGCWVAGVESSSPQLYHHLRVNPFDSGWSRGVACCWPDGIERVTPTAVRFCGVAGAPPQPPRFIGCFAALAQSSRSTSGLHRPTLKDLTKVVAAFRLPGGQRAEYTRSYRP